MYLVLCTKFVSRKSSCGAWSYNSSCCLTHLRKCSIQWEEIWRWFQYEGRDVYDADLGVLTTVDRKYQMPLCSGGHFSEPSLQLAPVILMENDTGLMPYAWSTCC